MCLLPLSACRPCPAKPGVTLRRAIADHLCLGFPVNRHRLQSFNRPILPIALQIFPSTFRLPAQKIGVLPLRRRSNTSIHARSRIDIFQGEVRRVVDEEHAWYQRGDRELHIGGSARPCEGSGARDFEYGLTRTVKHGERSQRNRKGRAVIRSWGIQQYGSMARRLGYHSTYNRTPDWISALVFTDNTIRFKVNICLRALHECIYVPRDRETITKQTVVSCMRAV